MENYKAEQSEISKKAYNSLKNISDILKNKPAVTKAILFGSLIHGTYTKGSDVDMAIEGIPPSDFFSTWREIEENLGIEMN